MFFCCSFYQPLRFTLDGKTPAYLPAVFPKGRGAQETRQHNPTFGIRFYLKVNCLLSVTSPDASRSEPTTPVPSSHTFIVFYDMERVFILNTHTFHVGAAPWERNTTEATVDEGGLITSRNMAVDGDLLSVGVYNVWNSNPPGWIIRGYERWKRYWKRMQLLADTLRAEMPEIITFQARVCTHVDAGYGCVWGAGAQPA